VRAGAAGLAVAVGVVDRERFIATFNSTNN